jgi:hypothetical protein
MERKRFEKVSTKLKHKFLCKNIKFMLVLTIMLLMFILIVVLAVTRK